MGGGEGCLEKGGWGVEVCRNWEVGNIFLSVALAIRSQQETGVANSSIDCWCLARCSTPEVADSGRWKKLPDGFGLVVM